MKTKAISASISAALVGLGMGAVSVDSYGYDFTTGLGDLHGSWVSNLTAGAGIRTKSPSCSLTGDPNSYGCGAAANVNQWGSSDYGDLNYTKGQRFGTYLSCTL